MYQVALLIFKLKLELQTKRKTAKKNYDGKNKDELIAELEQRDDKILDLTARVRHFRWVVRKFERDITKYLDPEDHIKFLSPFYEMGDHMYDDLYKVAGLQHLYVLLKNGITIYSQSLMGRKAKDQEEKDIFLGSAITAIESFLRKMIASDTLLKEVKQEGVSILIEEGNYVRIAIIANQDQKLLRERMLQFLQEFEAEYEEQLKDNVVYTRQFESVKDLVKKKFKKMI